MPQQTHAGGRVHPARSSIEEMSAHLGTDVDRGLTPGEAAKRLEKGKCRPLFRRDSLPLSACLKQSFREPVLWILLAVSVVALFFDRVAVGLSCILLALVNGVICAWAHRYAEQIDKAMQIYDVPFTRVLRGGRVVRVPADGVVPGDVILLYPGDVVPADVRLLMASDVVVTERPLDGDDSRQPLRLTKNAEILPTEMPRLHSPENMIFAGAVMEKGQARALVVEVGERTHVGGRTGGIASAHPMRTPTAYRNARRYISLWNLLLAFVIVPVTAIGIFTLGSRFDLLDLFMTSLALAVVSLTEHLMAQGHFMGAWIRARAAENRDADNAADIKTSVDLERLGEMTHLVMIGTAGLHDGKLRPDTLTTAGQSYTLPMAEPDRAAQAFSRKLFLWKKALTDQAGIPPEEASLFFSIDEINAWADPDPDALALRVKHLVARWGEVMVTLRNGQPVYLRITSDFAEVDACEQVTTAQGAAPFDGKLRYDWYRAYGHARHGGLRAYFLISETDGVRCAEGMMTLSAHVCRKTAGCLEDLTRAGICVTSFLRDVSEENARLVAAVCRTGGTPLTDRPVEGEARTPAIEAVKGGAMVFEGCNTAFIAQYIHDVHAAGGRVGIFSVEDEDMSLLAMADLAITCAPDLYTAAKRGEIPRMEPAERAEADGLPHSDCATDLARRRAHVLVRRSHVHGGGVCGIRQALLTAACFQRGLYSASRFLFVSHLLRLVAVLLPVICGLTLLSAPAVLLSGLVVDLLAVICYAFSDRPISPDDPADGGVTRGLARPHITFLWDMVAAGVAVVLPWIAVGVATLTGYSFGGSTAYIGFLSLIGTQLVLFLTGHPPRRCRLTFVVTLAMTCLYVGGLAMALGTGLHVLWCLAWPLVSPLAFLAVYGVQRLVSRQKHRQSTEEN